jgi:hypothetical protein
MNIFTEYGVVENFFKSQVVTVSRWNCVRTSLRVHGDTSSFVEVNVGASVEDDRVRWLNKVSADSELIGLLIDGHDEFATDIRRKKQNRKCELTIVPETQKRPASLPASLAILSCSSLVAWSSYRSTNESGQFSRNLPKNQSGLCSLTP